MKDCGFCKLLSKEDPIWENKDFFAVLDLFPNTPGLTLVISKKHLPSYIFNLSDKKYTSLLLAAKKVTNKLEKGLKVKRVAMIVEGTEIDHAHIKLYPLHGLKKTYEYLINTDEVFFKKFPGYITTKHGPKANQRELNRLIKKIKEA